MSSRPLEHVVLLSVATVGEYDGGEEASTILLAWLIHNVSTNKTVSKEEVYVQPPDGVPSASDLPPGVSAAAVKDAGSLANALEKLHDSLTKLGGTTFSIMTITPRPLRQFLHPEADRLGLTLEQYLDHYLDLGKELRITFPSAPVTDDLDKMAEFLNFDCGSEGQKVGLAELIPFCKIVVTLIAEGHVFQKLEVVKKFDSSKTASPDRTLVKSDAVLSLRGMPFQATIDDVARFLTGLNIIPGGIVFGTNHIGRRTGEAVVAMETAEEAELALERNKHYIGSRYIEVSMSTPEEFWPLVEVEDPSSDGVCVVRMQGLPYSVTREEIVEFFTAASAKVKAGCDGVLLIVYPDGRASGDGYAVFDTKDDLKAALSCDREHIQGYSRYVELYRSSLKDLKSVLSVSATPEQQSQFSAVLGTPISANSEIQGVRGQEKKCVKLRGLPFQCGPEAVIDFFGPLKNDIASKGVHMVLNSNNKPMGVCYVQMKSEESARKALNDLNKQYIENRYIEVFQCSGDEVARVLMEQSIGSGVGGGYRSGRSGGGGGRRGGGGGRREDDGERREDGGGRREDGGGRRGGGGGRREGGGERREDGGERREGGGRRRQYSGGSASGNVVKARGLPFKVALTEVVDFFSEYDVCENDVELLYTRDGRALGIALVSFSNAQLAETAIREKNRKYLGQRYIELSLKD